MSDLSKGQIAQLAKYEQDGLLGYERYKQQLLNGLSNNTDLSDKVWVIACEQRLNAVNRCILYLYEKIGIIDTSINSGNGDNDFHDPRRKDGTTKTVNEVFDIE